MTKTIWTGMCTAIVSIATAGITAQTTSPPSNAANAERKITVTGCLKQAPASSTDAGAAGPAGTVGTAGAAGAAGTAGDTAATLNFLLTNAAASATDTGASPAAATPPVAAGTSRAQTYRLIANPTALIPHVGKKVELTGTLDDSGTKPPEPSAAPEVNALTLEVESGKIVAASCSG